MSKLTDQEIIDGLDMVLRWSTAYIDAAMAGETNEMERLQNEWTIQRSSFEKKLTEGKVKEELLHE